MMDLDIGVVQDVEKRQKKRLLLDYLAENLKHHNWWAYRYFFCEFLALVNIVGKNFHWLYFHNLYTDTIIPDSYEYKSAFECFHLSHKLS